MERPVTASPRRWRWAGVFAAAGALGLGTQTVLLREYLVTLQGDEAAVGFGLAAWLLGIALGAQAARAPSRPSPTALAAVSLGLLPVTGCGGVLVARWGRSLLGVPAGELVTLSSALLLALAVFLAPGALVGSSFVTLGAAATRASADGPRAIGRLYVIEALGSLIAGLLLSLVLIPRLPPLAGFAVLAAAALAPAAAAAQGRLIGGRVALPLLTAAALVVAVAPGTAWLEAMSQRARFASMVQGMPLLAWEDTPYQSVAIGGGDVRALYENGQYVTSFPDPEASETLAHQLMLLSPRPRRVLALGGLDAGLLRFCLLHAPERVDLAVLDRRAFELVRRHLDPEDARAFADPRVHLRFADPRRFLATAPAEYDLILLLQPDPSTLLLARATTLEFARLVARRLTPQGVYVTRFSAGANVQSGETGRLGASLFRTLQEVFPVVHAAPGPPGLLVAGADPDAVTLAPERLASRYRSRGLESDVFVPELLPVLFPAERVAELERELATAARGMAPSRDDRPLSFLHALTLRQEVSRSAGALLLDWGRAHPMWLGLASLGPSVLLALWRGLRRRAMPVTAAVHATLVTGATGMALGLLLFFSFQARVGALYLELGLLSGAFMLGLSAGGAWATRHGSLVTAQVSSAAAALVVTLAFLLLDQAAPTGAWLGGAHALLLLVAGAGTGSVFPTAVSALLAAGGSVRSAAGWIEFADHAGAAVAALLAPVLFLPVLGLRSSALLLTGLQVVGALLVVPDRRATVVATAPRRGDRAEAGSSSRSRG